MYALGIAATGLEASQKVIDVTANNIANADSIAFKKLHVATTDLQYNIIKTPIGDIGSANAQPAGIYVGTGTKVAGTFMVSKQGGLNSSEHPLHIAINGSGYFAVTLKNGQRAYTRAGNFTLNSNRQIVTSEGDPLDPNIIIAEGVSLKDIKIDNNGVVSTTSSDASTEEMGQILLYTFSNENGLTPQGAALYLATDASGEAIENTPSAGGTGSILQNYLELSNVNAATELVNLMRAQKVYEMNIKVMKVADNIMQSSIDLVK